ncbi:MAG: LysR substrate-binding domain-containing protein [Ornithinimicrobium sp.]
MFNPDHLLTLQAVVEEGTVLGAADRLGLTASAVSQQLSRLQRDVPQPIMHRRGRANVPTEAAGLLVRLAQQMRDLDEQTRSELEMLDGQVSGSLTMASFPTGFRGLLIPATVGLRERHPNLVVTLHELSPESAVAAVRAGTVDVALVHDWTDRHVRLQDGVSDWPIGLDRVDLVAREDHPFTVGPDGIDFAELDHQVWIDDTPGVFSDWLLQSLDAHRLSYRIGATVEHLAIRLRLVLEGFGIGLLPRLGRGDLPDGLVTLPLKGAPTRRLYAVHRDVSGQRPDVRAALTLMEESWQEASALPS